VARAGYTYEVRKGPTDPVWVEDYVVRTSDGASVGTVAAVLDRDGERLLVVERGLVPVAQDRRVVPWRDVEDVDHDALAVWLRQDESLFLHTAVELDPDLAVEEGDAEARRLRRVPDEELPPARSDGGGPLDKPTTGFAIFSAMLTAFSVLVLVVLVTATESATALLFGVVPLGFAVVALLLAYRSYRSPYARRGAPKP
jgi:hypothetical protein